MFSTFKSLVGISPYEMIKKKNETIEKGKLKPLKASNIQQTRWTVSCVFQETKWVSFSRRGTITLLDPMWTWAGCHCCFCSSYTVAPVFWLLFLLRLWKHYKAPTINTLLRMWGHSNVTSQGASSLESLEDQQTLELWVNGYWEGAEKRKYGPCAPWAPWWASLGVCLIAGEFVLPSFHRHSDLKGAISVLIQIIW